MSLKKSKTPEYIAVRFAAYGWGVCSTWSQGGNSGRCTFPSSNTVRSVKSGTTLSSLCGNDIIKCGVRGGFFGLLFAVARAELQHSLDTGSQKFQHLQDKPSGMRLPRFMISIRRHRTSERDMCKFTPLRPSRERRAPNETMNPSAVCGTITSSSTLILAEIPMWH